MSRRTGLFWDAIQVATAHVFVPLLTVPRATPRPAPRAACDHGAPAGWQIQSMHRTSEGTVAYARCPCGAVLVLLDGQPLAAVDHPRPRAATPPVPGEHPLGRGRGWLWLWKGRQRQRDVAPGAGN